MAGKCRARNPSTCRVHGEQGVFYHQMANQRRNAVTPSIAKDKVFHVGELNPDLKKSYSHEGQGLSISEHPEDWQSIARLSGDIWELKTPLKLLNFHALSSVQREAIYQWGAEKGWLEKQLTYSVSWFDDEWNQEMNFTFSSYEEALDESPDGKVVVSEDWVATASFPDSTVNSEDIGVLDKLAVIWVDRTHPDMHGVWWGDKHDVPRLSAPRGVICLGQIPKVISMFKKRVR